MKISTEYFVTEILSKMETDQSLTFYLERSFIFFCCRKSPVIVLMSEAKVDLSTQVGLIKLTNK